MTRGVKSKENQKKRDLDVDGESEESGVEKIATKIVQIPNHDLKYDIQEFISSNLPRLD